MDLLYQKVSQLTNRKRESRVYVYLMLTNSDMVQERWKEYIEDLYDKNNQPQEEDMHLETDTKDVKFEAALSELKMERQKEKMACQQNC